jgi:excisionase family DNA binding protein
MREHELLRMQLLKKLLELEEKLMADLHHENHNYQAVADGNMVESFTHQQEMGKEKAVFSVMELSDYLGVSTDCVYSMVRENQIPHVRVRRRILFHRHSIDSWIQGNP